MIKNALYKKIKDEDNILGWEYIKILEVKETTIIALVYEKKHFRKRNLDIVTIDEEEFFYTVLECYKFIKIERK
tara:strand:- start:346 stop:567 length:222 start_codon:yes stop_codon:yes gene_type:complete